MPSLRIIYASTSGHTEYVIGEVTRVLASSDLQADIICAEQAASEDLLGDDVLLLACGTWNTGSIEGQLNPHMYALLLDRAADIDLAGKHVALIALGDERYHFTAAAMDHLREFVSSHGGEVMEPTLTVINEPYGQEKKIRQWCKGFAEALRRNTSADN